MEEQVFSTTELLGAYFFMGSITFVLGVVGQTLILKKNGASWLKIISYVTVAQILSSIAGVLIWLRWLFPFNVMQGFVLIPVAFPELILTVLFYFLSSPQKE